MECCYTEYKKADGFSVTPVFAAPSPECCEVVPACYDKPVLFCCEKKSPKVVYCCENKEVVYNCDKKPSGGGCSSEKKPAKVVYCCEKEPPKVVYCCDKKPSRCCEPPPTPKPSHCCDDSCKPVKTKYIMPCYRYEDGRIVRKLPVTAFKRNGMQDQEHSKLLGTTNFLVRCPRDVSVECDVTTCPVKVADPAKVPCFLRKKPIKNQPTVLMRRACEVACGRRKPFVVSSYRADPDHEERRYHSEDAKGNCCYHFERSKPQCCVHVPCCNPCVPTGLCVPGAECQYVSCLPANPCSAPSCCYYCK